MKVIYEPRGRAGEYSPLALNIYSGCSHGCTYCYVPGILRRTPGEFQEHITERKEILRSTAKDAFQLSKNRDNRTILLSFTSDPYQHLEEKLKITSKAIL